MAESLAVTAAGRMISRCHQLRLRLTAANWAEVARAVLQLRGRPLGQAKRGLLGLL